MMRLRHKDNSIHVELAKMQEDLSDAMSGVAGDITNQQIAAFLRQENLRLEAELDIYSDLANMGLAAEIVSHEFNQLFINVNNAIKNMAPYVRDPNAKYWLKQIDMGFRTTPPAAAKSPLPCRLTCSVKHAAAPATRKATTSTCWNPTVPERHNGTCWHN